MKRAKKMIRLHRKLHIKTAIKLIFTNSEIKTSIMKDPRHLEVCIEITIVLENLLLMKNSIVNIMKTAIKEGRDLCLVGCKKSRLKHRDQGLIRSIKTIACMKSLLKVEME